LSLMRLRIANSTTLFSILRQAGI